MLGVQDGANLSRESGEREWLREEGEIRVVTAVMNNGVCGVTGNIQHAHLGMITGQALSKLHAAATGKHHIGKQKIDATVPLDAISMAESGSEATRTV